MINRQPGGLGLGSGPQPATLIPPLNKEVQR